MAQKPDAEFPLVANLGDGNSTSGKPPSYNNTLCNNNIYINIIHTNINYNPVFINSNNKKLVDNIVDIMNEVLCSNVEYVTIGGNNVPLSIIKSIFLKVEMSHIQYVINVVNNYGKKINNIKGFIITTLYNSVLTLDVYYTNSVNTDIL